MSNATLTAEQIDAELMSILDGDDELIAEMESVQAQEKKAEPKPVEIESTAKVIDLKPVSKEVVQEVVAKKAQQKAQKTTKQTATEKPAKAATQKKSRASVEKPSQLLMDAIATQLYPDEKTRQIVAEGTDNANVKVTKKIINLLRAMRKEGNVSVFLRIAIENIKKTPLTKKELVELFMDANKNGVKAYAKGTATAQAQNIFGTLRLLKLIDDNEKGSVTFNDSPASKALDAIL